MGVSFLNNLKAPRTVTQYKLMQGVTDYGNLAQFNLFETGYSFLRVCQIPIFMQQLARKYEDVAVIVENYKRLLEFEFRGLDGLDNLTSETLEITNGISSINLISKVTQQSAATVSMQFFERSGSTITKFNELFLRGVKDPQTEIKHYFGLIKDGTIPDPGYEYETFILLYLVTDNTALKLERAYLLLAAQPTKADLDIYNSTKGEIDKKEITVEFNCFPVMGSAVNAKAKEMLDWMNNDQNEDQIITDSSDYNYTGLSQVTLNKNTKY